MKAKPSGNNAVTSVLIAVAVIAIAFALIIPAIMELAQGLTALADSVNGALSTGKI